MTKEQELRARYAELCGQLGDFSSIARMATERVKAIEAEIDRMNAALPDAQAYDKLAAKTLSVMDGTEPPA